MQAIALDEILTKAGVALDAAVNLWADEKQLIPRLAGRRVCRECRATWHLEHRPPRNPEKCDRCGGELFQRPDDEPGAIRTRLTAYAATAQPVIGHYRAQGRLVEVDADGTPEVVFSRVEKVLRRVAQAQATDSSSAGNSQD